MACQLNCTTWQFTTTTTVDGQSVGSNTVIKDMSCLQDCCCFPPPTCVELRQKNLVITWSSTTCGLCVRGVTALHRDLPFVGFDGERCVWSAVLGLGGSAACPPTSDRGIGLTMIYNGDGTFTFTGSSTTGYCTLPADRIITPVSFDPFIIHFTYNGTLALSCCTDLVYVDITE